MFSASARIFSVLTRGMSSQVAEWVSYSDRVTGEQRRFRLYRLPAGKEDAPGVVFVPGFMSHGKGTKAAHLLQHCRERGHEYVCYDPEMLGESLGSDHGDGQPTTEDQAKAAAVEAMATLEFRHWLQDCEHAVGRVQAKKVFLVGSSLGGMISLKTALEHPQRDRISGMLLIAPAVNLLRFRFQQWYDEEFDDATRQKLDRGEIHVFQGPWGLLPVRKSFYDNVAAEEIDLSSPPIDVTCPVTVIHGLKDDTVPHRLSMDIVRMVKSDKVDLIYRKNGEHRMSEPDDLRLIARALEDLIGSAGEE